VTVIDGEERRLLVVRHREQMRVSVFHVCNRWGIIQGVTMAPPRY
jgi:hypothetical protein